MNLVTDPWVPVIYINKESKKVSLNQLYQDAESIRDLIVTPPQRVAVMRLLICITQAALDGPDDEGDWYNCRDRIARESLRYLKEKMDCFELYGERPFLQYRTLGCDMDKLKEKAMLDQRLATGNNSTFFDHEAVAGSRIFEDHEAALNFLTFLNFSTSGKVGQAILDNMKYSDSTFRAPCVKYAHTFVMGENINDTIFLNLLTKNGEANGIVNMPNSGWGKPVWEMFPKDVQDTKAFENASHTYLGRLVPLSRFIRLELRDNEAKCIIGPTHKDYSIQQLPLHQEPSGTVVRSKKDDTLYYLQLSSNKHMWRELGSITSMNMEIHGARGAMTLNNLNIYYGEENKKVSIWVGGMELGKNEGKINDFLEWRFSFELSQMYNENVQKYKNRVEQANVGENSLIFAIKKYCGDLSIDTPPYHKGRHHYWSNLDAKSKILIDTDNFIDVDREWDNIIKTAMHNAYAFACPHTTPRQIQAFAAGKRRLH